MPIIPNINISTVEKLRPISIVCVKYSEEFEHNIAQSECIRYAQNELITIDNTCNLFYKTLCKGLVDGIQQAKNDLIVLAHEDVYLPDGWQFSLEKSLQQLEKHDKSWMLAGISRSDQNRHAHDNLAGGMAHSNHTDSVSRTLFTEASRLNDHLLILRKSNALRPDANLPRHHHLGLDLSLSAKSMGGTVYSLNTPVIHRHANEKGFLISSPDDSLKSQQKQQLGYLAGRACTDEYLSAKWVELDRDTLKYEQPGAFIHAQVPSLTPSLPPLSEYQKQVISSPIVLLAKGGGGSRLLSTLASDIGIFRGNDVNPTGDSREMARSVYRAIFRQYSCPTNSFYETISSQDLRKTAELMLRHANWPGQWAFKVPESLLILPHIRNAFPNARYIFLGRDPISTALRGTHMTAETSNPVGQLTLSEAYDFLNVSRKNILIENKEIRLARTTVHQLTKVLDFKLTVKHNNWVDIKLEDLINNPSGILSLVEKFTGSKATATTIMEKIDISRATINYSEHSVDTISTVSTLLKTIRSQMGYI